MLRSSLLAAVCCTAGAVAFSSPLLAQSTDPPQRASTASRGPTLALEDAIALALKHNPDYLSQIEARRTATAQRRAAYGGFLPGANISLQGSYQKTGSQPIGGVSSNVFSVNSDTYGSSYGIGLTYGLSVSTFLAPRIQTANVHAADADVVNSAQTIRTQVAQGYVTTLQDHARAALQDSLIVKSLAQLELAKAKLAVGSGTQLDVTQAEVDLGRAKVNALQAHTQVEIDKVRLFQTLGVPQPANVELTTQFEVHPPTFTLDSVLSLARQQNPVLMALRARGRVAALNVRSAQSEYLPALQVSASWGGYTSKYANPAYLIAQQQQQTEQSRASCFTTDSIRVGAGLPSAGDCNVIQFTPQAAAALRTQNSRFPFDFTKQPFQLSAGLSLPLFDGFRREQSIAQARANQNTAAYNVRKQELQLTADVTSAYLTLVTDGKAVELQEQNAAQAAEQLRLVQERDRVGAATYLDLANARATYEQAQNDRITATYTYHSAFAALENAVGRPLR